MAADTNSNEIRIRAKKISSIQSLPDDYLNQDNANNSYMLVAYNDGETPGYNYKVAISKIMNQIEDNLIEDPRTHGKSAYEIAVEHGYEGSEEDWINNIINTSSDALEQLRTELIARIESYNAVRSITCNLTNISANSSNASSVTGSTPVTLSFLPHTGYSMPDDNGVTVEGAQFDYNKAQKTILLHDYTSTNIIITMVTNNKIECSFRTTSLDNNKLSVSLSEEYANNVFTMNDEFEIHITVNEDGYTYPTNIICTGCSKVSYDNTTGVAILKCTGANTQMIISGTAKDIHPYIFSYALQSNENVFTVVDNNITEINWNTLEQLGYTVHTTGTSPINYISGITWDSSVNVEREKVWFVIPKKYYNMSDDTFNDDNGNKYVLLDVFGRKAALIETPQVVTYNNIEYILYLISNNGSTDTQTFGRI